MASPRQNSAESAKKNQETKQHHGTEVLDESELERQYQQHKRQFEQWKEQNKRLENSATYQNYIKQFEAWEVEVERRRQLIRSKRAQAEAAAAAAKATSAAPAPAATSSGQNNVEVSVSGPAASSGGTDVANQAQPPENSTQSGQNGNPALDPFAFMMGMMSMMFFDPLTMSMMSEESAPAPDGRNPPPVASLPPTGMPPPDPHMIMPPQGYGPPMGPPTPNDMPPRISHAQAAQEMATRQRERDWEARAGRMHRFPPPEFPGGPEVPRGPRYGPPPPEHQMPTLGPDYGYGGSRGMWGGHETANDSDDPMFRRWGRRADPPSKGPVPSAAYDQRPYDFTEMYPPPYGTVLPPGWVMGEPIRKERMLRPPPPDYRGGRPAFRDFTMR